MIQCPDCRNMIPDDSAFCDQCGRELKWCPECKRPKRGTQCPVCGSDLVPGRKYLAGLAAQAPQQESSQAAAQGPAPAAGQPAQAGNGQASPKVQAQKPQDTAARPATARVLVGNGWRLVLKDGDFGRRGGIWPELSSCIYVSGNHGKIISSPSGWLICDLGSTNGTQVNGQKLSAGAAAPLNIGDRVRIATLDFVVE